MMAVGQNIFFARELYITSGIFVGHSRDSPDSFHLILSIYFRLLELNICNCPDIGCPRQA